MSQDTNPEKLLLVRVQDDLHGARHDGKTLTLGYDKTTGSDRNTLHFTVNSIVPDTPYGKFTSDSAGELKGKIVIVADPKDMPVPAGWGQVDSWWRLHGERGAQGELHRGLPVGDATIIAPVGTEVPKGALAVFYDGGVEARDAAVKQVVEQLGAELRPAGFWGWSGHGQLHEDWRRETAAQLWPGQEQHIHLGPHQGSLDNELENATLHGQLKAMTDHGRLHEHSSGAQVPWVDVMTRTVEKARADMHTLMTDVAPPQERPLIQEHYREQLQRLENHLAQANKLDQEMQPSAPAPQHADVPPPLPQTAQVEQQQQAQVPPPPPLAAKVPPPLPEAAQIPPADATQASAAQPKKSSIRYYEVPGNFELTAEGREPRFYDNARLAGEAFYAARREDQPRVMQHYLDGFEDRTGQYETPSTRTIAITARTATPDQKLEHIFLADSAEFKAGYEAARSRLPDKAVLTEDWTQPAGPQQSTAAPSLPPSAQSPGTSEAPVSASSTATEPKGQTVSDQQTSAAPPRVQVGQDPNHWLNENAQWNRDVADRRGLTAGIEAQFAQGKTAKQVIKAMDKELEFLPIEDRSNFIVGVRATLGIPSQATSDGQQEFKAWKAEYDKRQAHQYLTATQPQQEGPAMNMTRLQIDGVDVGRLAFEKHSTPHGVFVDLTALDRNEQPLAEFIGVDKIDLTKILGPTVGHEIAKFNGRTGEFTGQQLDVPAAEVAHPARAEPAPAAPQPAAQAPRQEPAAEQAPKEQATAAVEAPPARRMEIDGREVQRVSYIKMQKPEGLRYDVTAYGTNNTVLGRHPALTKEDLPQYLGETPAKHIENARGRNGSLRGDQLGLREHEARPQLALPLDLTPREGPDRSKEERAAAPAAVAQAQQQQQPAPAQSHEAQPSMPWPDTSSPAQRSEPIVNSIERSDALRQAGPSGQRTAEHPAAPAGPVQQPATPENPFLAAPEVAVDLGERRRQELLASLAERFTINAGEYRYRHDQAHVAFVDRDTSVTTHRNEPEIARAMVDLAEAKGWKGLHLKGTEPFRAAAWMEASVRGLKSHGYEPTRADRERLAIRLRDQQINRVEPAQDQAAGRQQQAAPNAAPAQTPQRDDVLVRREEALGVLESYLKSQNKSPQEIAGLLKQGGEMLDKMVAAGQPLPQARVYDINAQRAHTVHVQPQREVNSPARSR